MNKQYLTMPIFINRQIRKKKKKETIIKFDLLNINNSINIYFKVKQIW